MLFVYGLFVGATSDANFLPIEQRATTCCTALLALALLGSWAATRNESERAEVRGPVWSAA